MTAARGPALQHDRQGHPVHCMYSHANPSQRCDEVISLYDLEWAGVLWQTLRACPPHSQSFRQILDEYSRVYLCPRHQNQIDVHHQDYWQRRLDAWSEGVQRHFYRANPRTSARISRTSSHPSRSPRSPATPAHLVTPPHLGSTSSAPTSPSTHQPASKASSEHIWTKLQLDSDCHRRNKSASSTRNDHNQSKVQHRVDLPRYGLYAALPGAQSSLESIITTPLTIADSQPGYIYAYRRISEDAMDSHHIRIGHTPHKLDEDTQLWSTQCHYSFQLVCPTVKVRNAARVEALIYKELELDVKRRLDLFCKIDRKRCQTVHDNWFRVSVSAAELVIQYWASWMESNDPYDSNGHLRQDLVQALDNNGGESRRIRSAYVGFVLDSRDRCWQTPDSASLASKSPRLSATHAKSTKPRARPPIPRRRTSLSLSDYESVSHIPLRETARSKSVACFRTLVSEQSSRTRTNSPPRQSRARSSSTPPSTKFLRRVHRNASLRSFVVDAPKSAELEVREAQVIRRQKGRSIYIPAASLKKITILQDLSRIQMERN